MIKEADAYLLRETVSTVDRSEKGRRVWYWARRDHKTRCTPQQIDNNRQKALLRNGLSGKSVENQSSQRDAVSSVGTRDSKNNSRRNVV